MQSARRPLTRDASGPGFRFAEPHRFRSAAQPTDLHERRRRRISSIRVRGAPSKSVPTSRHRGTPTSYSFETGDNWLEWFSLLFQRQRSGASSVVVLRRSRIEHLMYVPETRLRSIFGPISTSTRRFGCCEIDRLTSRWMVNDVRFSYSQCIYMYV